MLETLRGVIAAHGEGFVLLECGPVGLRLRVPAATADAALTARERTFHCHLALRDDQFHLYGFETMLERDLFRTLLGVSGLGPEKALGLLSARSPGAIARAVDESSSKEFQVVKGIGARLAQRIVVELAGRLSDLAIPTEGLAPASGAAERDLVNALTALGYPRGLSEATAAATLSERGSGSDMEELVKSALRSLQRQA